MRIETINVYWHPYGQEIGQCLTVAAHVADSLGLRANQRIRRESRLWEVIGANSTERLRLILAEIEAENGAPS